MIDRMSAAAVSKQAQSSQVRSGVGATRNKVNTKGIFGDDEEDKKEFQETFGIQRKPAVRAGIKKDAKITYVKQSTFQSMTVVSENARRQLNTTVKGQREMRAEIRGTAEQTYKALTSKIQQSTNAIRSDMRNLAGQVKQSFAAVYKQMSQLQSTLQKMDEANQQRFLSLQRNLAAMNQQIANNHKEMSELVNQRARETQAAVINRIDARFEQLKNLQVQLTAHLQGEFTRQMEGLSSQVQGLGQELKGQLADVGKQLDSQGQQIGQMNQKLDEIQKELGMLGNQLKAREAELAKQNEPLVTIYTCTSCGGSVHQAGCISSSDPSSRISFKVKRSEFDRLKAQGRISEYDSLDIGGEIGYRIDIGKYGVTAADLRAALVAAGVTGI